jgi:hypothetical protein
MDTNPRVFPAIGPDAISSELGFRDYADYRSSIIWKKIRRRVLERDDRKCAKCGGKASLVHHRTYTLTVLRGEGDHQLVSLCEGCHAVIHTNEDGSKRPYGVWNEVLSQKDDSTEIPVVRVDLRRKLSKQTHPAGWDRVSAFRRTRWEKECLKKIFLRQLNKSGSPLRRKLLREWYQMSDSEIDKELFCLPQSMAQRRINAERRIGTEVTVGGQSYRITRVVAIWRGRDAWS